MCAPSASGQGKLKVRMFTRDAHQAEADRSHARVVSAFVECIGLI